MTKPLIPWMGGKRRLASDILPLINGWRTYVEPFCGGASMFFMKEPSKVEVINDLNGELVNLYRIVKHHPDELARQFDWILIARQEFDRMKKHSPDLMTDVQRAARFYFIIKTCFGSKVSGPTFGTAKTSPTRFNRETFFKDIDAAYKRLSRTTIENRDWEKCINQYDSADTCFYLDPPYYQTAGYGQSFPFENYKSIADLMASCKGRMVLSINDHPQIRHAFAGFHTKQVQLNYTVGSSNTTKRQELIIWNR